MTVYLAPGPFGCGGQFFTNGGLPLNGGLIYTYEAGTTTPKATYTTVLGNVQNANPIELDGFGRPPQEIWLLEDAYDFDLKDSLDNPIRTYQDISGILDINMMEAILSASNGSSLIGFLQAGTGAVLRTVQAKDREIISVTDFGAVGDGVANDSVAIQAAIDYANTFDRGATVTFPPGNYLITCGLITLKTKVRLVGSVIAGQPGVTTQLPRLIADSGTSGWMIDTPASEVNTAGILGLGFKGAGVGENQGGVRGQNFRAVTISGCSFDDFDNQAIQQLAGGQNTYFFNFAQNCLLDITRASKSGVIEIVGADCTIYGGEYTPSLSAVSDSNLRICGIALIGGGNHFVYFVVAEFADVGIYNSGTHNKLFGARADNNWGHGFEFALAASQNMLVGCHGFTNGQGTNDTYADFKMVGSLNRLTGCFGDVAAITTNRVKYTFEDSCTSDVFKNYYVGCSGENYVTSEFGLANTVNASAVTVFSGPPKVFTNADTTPDVTNYNFFIANNSGATSITTFDNGVGGQEITVIAITANTTFVNGSGINTTTGANVSATSGKPYKFILYNSIWYGI